MPQFKIQSIDTWDTGYPADSVEWCPVPGFQNIFVCGTYLLSSKELSCEEGKQTSDQNKLNNQQIKRLGRLYLFQVSSVGKFILLQELEVSGILDIKWCHRKINGNILLGVADSNCEAIIYVLKEENSSEETRRKKIYLTELCKTKLNVNSETNDLALSLDWSTGKGAVSDVYISVSDSRGYIYILRFDNSLEVVSSWNAHKFEAWITAFNYWNTFVIYSGGDDSKFRGYDTRIDPKSAIFTNSEHEAGVTSLHSNSFQEHLLISGSYDEKCRIWDTRNMKKSLNEINTNGSVWRVKWDPFCGNEILAACMHNGFHVIFFNTMENFSSIISSYDEHESLAYGSDWCHLPSKLFFDSAFNEDLGLGCSSRNVDIFAACSFYDHKLSLAVITPFDCMGSESA